MSRRYRAWVHIRGGISRPPYDGYVDIATNEVLSDDEIDARVKDKLRRSSFPDVWADSIKIDRIEKLR
jgi:hypothetical protein